MLDKPRILLLFLNLFNKFNKSSIFIAAKQNYGIAERVIVSVWCTVSTIMTAVSVFWFDPISLIQFVQEK